MMENQNKTVQNVNMDIYEKVRCVPDKAKKEIQAGRLKGKSDINPMWRIKMLTETFGPAGFGWYTEVVKTWTSSDESGDIAVFVDINLYVNRDGQWSHPIYGTGGNKLVTKEKKYVDGIQTNVPYLDDDAYKKAYTDAISVAAKALGIGADVYWEADKSKYDDAEEDQQAQKPQEVVKPVIAPEQPSWKQAVAFTASSPDSCEVIRKKMKCKYDITDENLDRLLVQAGKLKL